MRWATTALAGALVVAVIGACSPDIIPVPARAASPASEATASPSGNLAAVCGFDVSADAGSAMLTAEDVWPDATQEGQAYASYRLDPTACAARLATTPDPVRCDLGFPYHSSEDAVATEFARMGVVGLHSGHILELRTDGTIASTVREYLIDLGADAGLKVAALVARCGAAPVAGDYVARSHGVIDMLLRVGPTYAVALTFDAHTGLSDGQKTSLLDRATELVTY